MASARPLQACSTNSQVLGEASAKTDLSNLSKRKLLRVPCVPMTPTRRVCVCAKAGLRAGSTPMKAKLGNVARKLSMATAVAVLQATTSAFKEP